MVDTIPHTVLLQTLEILHTIRFFLIQPISFILLQGTSTPQVQVTDHLTCIPSYLFTMQLKTVKLYLKLTKCPINVDKQKKQEKVRLVEQDCRS